jgi:hypothetical protein
MILVRKKLYRRRNFLCLPRHLSVLLYSAMIKDRRNYYRILKVQPDAPTEIIRASYRTLMKELKLHPDLGGSTAEASILNEAYETLHDPVRRAAYDEKLFLQFIKQTVSQPHRPVAPVLCPICRRSLSRKPEPGDVCQTCRTPLQTKIPQSPERPNSRKIERIRSSEPISFYSKWPGNAGQGRMMDFSPRGMRFLCSEKLTPNTVMKISSKVLEALGTVTNVNEEISGRERHYAVGVRFLAVHFAESRGTFLSTSA